MTLLNILIVSIFTLMTGVGFSTMALVEIKGTDVALENQRETSVMSFKEWKQYRLKSSLAKYSEIKKNLKSNQTESRVAITVVPSSDPNLEKAKKTELQSRSSDLVALEIQLKNEQMNYEMAKDLTASDYFVGYLSKLSNSKTALRSAAEKLSPEEVAEIMSAFANTARRMRGEQEIAPASRLIEMRDLSN